MIARTHTLVLKVEDGYTSWRLICPDGGAACGPGHTCASCGRAVGDAEVKPCYDCPTSPPEGCWAQSWVGEAMAEEVIHGTVEVSFPVDCQYNGDGFEAHVLGPPVPFSEDGPS